MCGCVLSEKYRELEKQFDSARKLNNELCDSIELMRSDFMALIECLDRGFKPDTNIMETTVDGHLLRTYSLSIYGMDRDIAFVDYEK